MNGYKKYLLIIPAFLVVGYVKPVKKTGNTRIDRSIAVLLKSLAFAIETIKAPENLLKNDPNTEDCLIKQTVEKSLMATSAFGICTAILFTDNEEETHRLLLQINIPFSTQNVLVASLPDEPGTFGNFSQLLFDQGIRVSSFYLLRFTKTHAHYAFTVDEADFEKAQAFLDASGFLQITDNPKKSC